MITGKKILHLFAVIVLAFAYGCVTSIGPAPGEPVRPPSSAVVVEQTVMPSGFVGCWEGTIEGFDSVQPLSFSGHFVSQSMRVTYQLCYRHEGNHNYRLDLTKVEVDGKQATITYFENHVTATDAEHNSAHLRNHGIAVQHAYIMFIFPVRIQQDVFADEDVVLVNHDLVSMKGEQLIQLSGSDIARMTFHADFRRVSD